MTAPAFSKTTAWFQPLPPAAKFAWLRGIMADPDLSPAAKLAAWGLVEHHNTTTGQLNPSAERLATVVGMTARGVRKGIAQLADRGLVAVTALRRGCRQGANAYRLVVSGNTVPSEQVARGNEEAGQVERVAVGQAEQGSAPEPLREHLKEPGGRGAAENDENDSRIKATWSSVMDLVARDGELGRQAVGGWLRSAELVDVAGDVLRIRMQSRVAADWVRARYAELIAAAAERVLGLSRVAVEIEAPAGAPRHADPGAARSSASRRPSAPRSAVPALPAVAGRVVGAGRPFPPRPAPAALPGAAERVVDGRAGGDRLGFVPLRSPSVWSPLVPGAQV